jgi:hypothetical protein
VKNTNFKNIKKNPKKGTYKRNNRILYPSNKHLKNQTMKNNKTKAERVEEQITLFLIIIGATYFLLMFSRLFFNF